MRRHAIVFLSCCLVLLIGASCTDSPPPQNQNTGSSEPATAPETNTGKPAAQESPPAVWPFSTSLEGETSAVAFDLLAKNYVLILDGSGSMLEKACNDAKNRTKIDVAKQAVTEWMQTLPPDANLGLIIFSNGWIILDIAPGSREPFKQAVQAIRPDGLTPLASAFKGSYAMLTKQAQAQLGYGDYTVVAITDGVDNDKDERLDRWVARILEETPIRIYTIGFCIGSNHELNQPGKMIYREAGNLEEIRKGLAEVVAEAETFDVTRFPK